MSVRSLSKWDGGGRLVEGAAVNKICACVTDNSWAAKRHQRHQNGERLVKGPERDEVAAEKMMSGGDDAWATWAEKLPAN